MSNKFLLLLAISFSALYACENNKIIFETTNLAQDGVKERVEKLVVLENRIINLLKEGTNETIAPEDSALPKQISLECLRRYLSQSSFKISQFTNESSYRVHIKTGARGGGPGHSKSRKLVDKIGYANTNPWGWQDLVKMVNEWGLEAMVFSQAHGAFTDSKIDIKVLELLCMHGVDFNLRHFWPENRVINLVGGKRTYPSPPANIHNNGLLGVLAMSDGYNHAVYELLVKYGASFTSCGYFFPAAKEPTPLDDAIAECADRKPQSFLYCGFIIPTQKHISILLRKIKEKRQKAQDKEGEILCLKTLHVAIKKIILGGNTISSENLAAIKELQLEALLLGIRQEDTTASDDAFEALQRSRGDINSRNHNRQTFLYRCVMKRPIPTHLVRKVLHAGADPNATEANNTAKCLVEAIKGYAIHVKQGKLGILDPYPSSYRDMIEHFIEKKARFDDTDSETYYDDILATEDPLVLAYFLPVRALKEERIAKILVETKNKKLQDIVNKRAASQDLMRAIKTKHAEAVKASLQCRC